VHIETGGGTSALTIDASQNSTFAGNVDITTGIIELGQNKIDGSSDNLKISADFGGVSGSSTIEFLVDGSEKMRIDNSGKVIINDNAIGDKLLLAGDNAGTARGLIFNCSTTTNQGDTWDINAQSSTGIIKFSTTNTERMQIDDDGNVSIDEFLRVGPNINNANTFDYSLQTRQLLVAGFSGTGESNIYIHRDDQTISGGNVIGNLNFSGQDGASNIGAKISAVASASWNATAAPSDIIFSNCASASNTLTERMRIDSSGNVGIKQANPGTILHISDGNTFDPSTNAPVIIVIFYLQKEMLLEV
jgi:hypothetical protein